MYLTLDSFLCQRGRISLPLTGAWTARLTVDPATSGADLPVLGSQVTLGIGEGGFTLKGTVARVNNAFDLVFMSLVGGAGGLRKDLPAKDYQNVSFGMVLRDVLKQCGEVLSSSTPAAILNVQLTSWMVMAGPAFMALAALVEAAKVQSGGQPVNWRVLPDGRIFVGVEPWPQAPMPSFDQMSWSPQLLSTRVFAENPSILPGQTWQSAHVTDVYHQVDPELSRTEVFFEDAAA